MEATSFQYNDTPPLLRERREAGVIPRQGRLENGTISWWGAARVAMHLLASTHNSFKLELYTNPNAGSTSLGDEVGPSVASLIHFN